MAVFATDLFGDATSVLISTRAMATGQNWVLHAALNSGTISTTGDGRAFASADNTAYVSDVNAATPDYIVRSNVRAESVISGFEVGVIGRASPTALTFYWVRYYYDGSNHKIELLKFVAGSFTQLNSTNLAGGQILSAGQSGLLELRMSGTSISSWWQGVQIASATDSGISTAGRYGIFGSSGTSTTGFNFLDFNADAPVVYTTVGVTNTNIYFSPATWFSIGGSGSIQSNNIRATGTTAAEAIYAGAYMYAKVVIAQSSDVRLLLDTTPQNGLTASLCKEIAFRKTGDTAYTVYKLVYSASQVEVNLGTGLAPGTYEFEVYVKGGEVSASSGNQWTGTNTIRINGLKMSDDSTLSAPTIRPDIAYIYADSLAEADYVSGLSDASTSHDAGLSWVRPAMYALGYEFAQMACGGQGYTRGRGNVAATADNPGLYNADNSNASWDKYNRDEEFVGITGQPDPDIIIIRMGANDQSLTSTQVADTITAMRGEWPDTPIFCLPNALRSNASVIEDGVDEAADANAYYLDAPPVALYSAGTGSVFSTDAQLPGSHANALGQAWDGANVAAAISEKLEEISGGGGGFVHTFMS